jgi:hypothetical protein
MNEVQLLRRQIAAERQHVRDINFNNSSAYSDYIKYILARERARAVGHLARLSMYLPLAPNEQAALTSLRDALGETIDLEATGGTAGLCNLIDTIESIELIAERRYSVEDWRSVAQLDADSVLEERRLWSEVTHRGTVAPDH